ncbi:DNA polymerase III subunit alpha [Nocardioides marmotae]|uniref:DNA polymerase III subunit alpha n=1 Tax=Nocardioides marmotae TaxID=2663857 RepID=A0A6I3JBW5_9ACTN|nr:DNA polymerase III subunit alpha [Nocardioides marmotae]MCR6031983.1 DNA polymerase III subunit alpha [Gordonia jinghuaiqii]MBC9732075.1 DNA polymerase III subunit alpha [Nocardioides marmotae]MTB83196.1 DNA polymerase III subunit alpha [Nocardioides marmotae]MTB95624.1 DNA polymerase III subunit alpha [Nocardioides marmotae]QKE01040.1 DNA polymerase III subunit alpha [Nocardioides marmotae]
MSTGSQDSFVHMHVHTEYSMLDGASLLDGLFTRVADLGMPAIAMTDHGNLHGAFDFWSKARKHGVKPIIGIEAYVTPGTPRGERKRVRWGKGDVKEEGGDDVAGGGAYTHMTMWAENTAGMHNLFRLSSRSSLEGYFYKPRMDKEILAEHSEGIIVSTGCPSGAIQTRLRLGQWDEAVREAGELQDMFGRDNVFLELMDHDISVEKRVRDDLLKLGRELGIPPLATNDSHYNNPEDAAAHDALICVASGKRLSDTNRLKFDGGGYYIKSAAEMRELWADRNGMREACDNTLALAERCEVEFVESTGGYMARADIPAGETEESWFRKEVWRGIESRYPGDRLDQEVKDRVEMELGVISAKGYCGYYLVVADFIQWAKDNGIRVGPGRGSGAGSIAAYALRITDLCPLEHGLFFERFLNPERPSMPDFDIDFDDHRRGEVIAYVTRKYGADRVAQIATFGRLKAKAAIKDAARVLDYGFAISDKITKALPADVMGKGVPLKELFNPDHKRYGEGGEFRALHDSDVDVRTIYETAVGLEGQIRNWGVHAAGVIMSSDPLIDIVPIMQRPQDGAIITQFDYPMCEALGLVKMDFLGLSNLHILENALVNIEANRGEKVVLEELPFDDRATYELMGRGDTLGVFQLDGGGMRALLRSMQPDQFADITAVSALYRPGPMGADSHNKYARRKNGREPIEPIHPALAEALEPVLGETYGLIVYQEQVMAIAQVLAGFTLGAADNLRRAMGKKKKEELDKQYAGFQAGMLERGFPQDAIDKLWEILLPFSDYAFNKSHSAAYGVITYWTAYLKANYPAEYMAALLTSAKDDKDKLAIYLNECRRMRIQVLPPDVNSSAHDFTPVGGDIRFGLTAIRNVGANVVDGIVAAREEKGRYTDFNDFLDKVPTQVCNKRVIESLIKAGAFDDLKHRRRALVAIHETAVDQYVDIKRNEAIGQDSLFGGLDDTSGFGVSVAIPDIDDWDKMTLLGHEREMLGLYVSDHPLLGLEHVLANSSDCTIGQLMLDEDRADGSPITVSGLVTSVQRKITKRGDAWAMITLEDLDGAIDVLLFPSAYQLASTYLTEDAILTVKGRLSRSKDQPELHGQEVTVPDISDGPSGPVVIKVPQTRVNSDVVAHLKDVLSTHPGVTEVHLRVLMRDKTLVMRIGDHHRVTPSPALFADLKQLLGPGCLTS